jgi:hypothetical protein
MLGTYTVILYINFLWQKFAIFAIKKGPKYPLWRRELFEKLLQKSLHFEEERKLSNC